MLKLYEYLLNDLARQMGLEIPDHSDGESISFMVDDHYKVSISLNSEQQSLIVQCDIPGRPVESAEERAMLLYNSAALHLDCIFLAINPQQNCLSLFRVSRLEGLTVEIMTDGLRTLLDAADRWAEQSAEVEDHGSRPYEPGQFAIKV